MRHQCTWGLDFFFENSGLGAIEFPVSQPVGGTDTVPGPAHPSSQITAQTAFLLQTKVSKDPTLRDSCS